jgi:hypothetical protein
VEKKKTKNRIVCIWSPHKTMSGGVLWETACGNGSKEVFKYCPHCGGMIVREKDTTAEKQLNLEGL